MLLSSLSISASEDVRIEQPDKLEEQAVALMLWYLLPDSKGVKHP